jgi:toxin FitB
LDTRIAREGARLMVGRSEDLFEDAMLAATARIHRLTIATRNLKDFAFFDVPIFNPFTYSN